MRQTRVCYPKLGKVFETVRFVLLKVDGSPPEKLHLKLHELCHEPDVRRRHGAVLLYSGESLVQRHVGALHDEGDGDGGAATHAHGAVDVRRFPGLLRFLDECECFFELWANHLIGRVFQVAAQILELVLRQRDGGV